MNQPVILGIDGRSGSGKSDMAKALARRIEADQSADGATAPTVSIFQIDRLYRGWDGLRAGIDIYAHDVIPLLAAGKSAEFRAWDWTANEPEGQLGATEIFEPTDIIIVEGFGAGAKPARKYLTSLLWLNAPEFQRKSRAQSRGGENYGADNWSAWAKQEQQYTDTDRVESAADLVLETTGPAEAVQDAAFNMLRFEVKENGSER